MIFFDSVVAIVLNCVAHPAFAHPLSLDVFVLNLCALEIAKAVATITAAAVALTMTMVMVIVAVAVAMVVVSVLWC